MGAFLTSFMDDESGCWAKVELQSGEPIWISVVTRGVLVKVSKWGLMGKKIFHENLGVSLLKAQYLSVDFPESLTPFEMITPELQAFTNAVLHCSNSSEVEEALATTS